MKFFLFLLLISFCESFLYYTPDTYPDSLRNPNACGLRSPGWACDPNLILGDNIAEAMNIISTNIQHNTNCSCENQNQCSYPHTGFTISVAILEKIKDDDDIINPSTDHKLKLAEVFANALRIRQNRGHCGDDILIVLSRSDGVIYTSLGMTAAKFLTPEVIQGTDKKIKSKLEKQEYFEALSEMILIYEDVLEGKSVKDTLAEPWYHPLPLWAVWAIGGVILFLLILVILLLVFCCFRRNKRREYSVGRANYNTRM